MKKGKMTEAEKLAWWAANKAKAEAKRKADAERLARLNRMNDPEYNELLDQFHGSNFHGGINENRRKHERSETSGTAVHHGGPK